jgi:MoaA/NifB/PqqE/SkfB family radical SAM enzyme
MKTYDAGDAFSTEYLKHNELTDEEWERVPAKLKELGVPFAPIYGAEPLTRTPALTNFVRECKNNDIATTVITNGALLSDDILLKLQMAGLTSMTMSHDIIPANKSLDPKTKRAEDNLEELSQIFEDFAVVVTLNRQNYKEVPAFVRRMSEDYNVWVCMDIYHPDRRQPGSKCKGVSDSLLFHPQDWLPLSQIFQELKQLKSDGYLLHPPIEYFDMLSNVKDVERYVHNYGWKCRSGSWITIDAGGSVFGCDDFQPEDFREMFNILELGQTWTWDDFVEEWRRQLKYCPGCFWSTHIASDLWWGETGWMENQTHGRVEG